MSALITALNYNDVGLVLALTGTIAATSLAYLLPGLLFIGVHGQEFLDLVESRWGCTSLSELTNDHSFLTFDWITWFLFLMPIWCSVAKTGKRCLAFYVEKKALQTPAQTFRLGKIKHRYSPTKQQQISSGHVSSESFSTESSPMIRSADTKQYNSMPSCTEEDDPQDEKQAPTEFLIAIGFVVFGFIALSSGLVSIIQSL